MVKLLVTGSNGLVGQKVAAMAAQNTEIELLATSLSYNKQPVVESFFKQLNINDANQLKRIVTDFRPQVIINCAGMTQVDTCEQQKEECWKLNVEAVEHLIHAAQLVNARLVHLSTDFVFDGLKGNYSEDDTPQPVSFYGLSKLEAEKRIQQNLENYCIIRTVLVYGVTPLMTRSNIVLWVKKSLENKKPIQVVNDQFRTPTLAENLAEGAIIAATSSANGIFHMAGGELMSVFEIAQRVADFFALDSSLISPISSSALNQSGKRPPKTGFNLYKAKTELGFHPTPFAEGLKLVSTQIKAAN